MSLLTGATNSTIDSYTINNIGENAMFDGDGPPNAEFKSLFANHLAGMILTPNLRPKVEKNALSQLIMNLPRADAAYNDCVSKGKTRVTCFGNTGQALLKEVGEWILAILDRPEIYLLSGAAGTGKSTVVQTVAERADNLHLLAASFFFSRDETDCRNAQKFYTTIAFQLCLYDEQFAQAIANALLEEKGASRTAGEPMVQLDTLIVEPLRHLVTRRSRPLVIVVDALDECEEEDALTILQTLEHLVYELPAFRVILTSRAGPRLGEYFDKHEVFHMQNIEDKVVDNDIRLYLKYHLSCEQVNSHLKLKNPWSAHDNDIESLIRAAGRLFIIASTAVSFILDTVSRNPAAQMKRLQCLLAQDRTPFNVLNELYTIILRSPISAGQCDRDVVRCYQNVIGTIAHVKDPLPVRALADLIGVDSEAVRAILYNIQPVILLGSNDVPRICHMSFLDYVTDAERCKDDDLLIIPRDQHTRITVHCFGVMNARLKRNILELGTPAQFMENSAGLEAEHISDDQVREKISSELQYACSYWADHFGGANIEDSGLTKKLDAFAKEHLLHWFEALSWIRKLDFAHRALLILTKSTTFDRREIFFDALSFVTKFYGAIRRSALHTYHSALPFTPSKILLYKTYKRDLHDLCQLQGGPEQWDDLVTTTMQGFNSDVHRVAFSQNGLHLAALAGKEMKLWDATSATPVKTLQSDAIELSEDFSTIVLSQNSTLKLHDVASNAQIANFKHSAKAIWLAVSFDGSRLAAGLSSGTVSLWNTVTGEPVASLGGYSLWDRQLEFSPSGYNIAFLSIDGGIRLWNGFNGELIADLSYALEEHLEFRFSRNGSRLAALTKKGDVHSLTLRNGENGQFLGVAWDVEWRPAISYNWRLALSEDDSLIATGERNVQLWNGSSLSLVDTLDVGEWIFSLAFSSDMLAIGSFSSVALYDLKTRAIIGSLPFSKPKCLAFSPDCTRFAAGNNDGAVQMWDAPNLKRSISTSMKQPRIVTALSFSPDCLRLASGFKDGNVELWDTGHRQVIATLTLHSQEVTALAFSPNGEQFASGSADETIRLWDSRDGASNGFLQHSFYGRPTSVAFSSRLLAAATWHSIILFDHKTLHFITAFPHASGDCLSFSLDGSLLASAYNDQSSAHVVVWDVETHARIARFHINSRIERLALSPDGSRLAAITSRHGDGSFRSFDLVSKDTIIDPGREEFSWISPNGVLISQSYDSDHGFCLQLRFSPRDDGIPILWIPQDVRDGGTFTVGSSMFALGCDDGRILIERIPSFRWLPPAIYPYCSSLFVRTYVIVLLLFHVILYIHVAEL